MKLKLNISPCPNDTFMFDALINGRIDTSGLEIEVGYYDIEQLNIRAMAGEADITKISYAVLPVITHRYSILDSGSALGRGNGPLLVAERPVSTDDPLRIAVPGTNTTANLLMGRLYPRQTEKTEVLFSEIADRVASGEFDAGVLIHEGRFTYGEKGLVLLADLGQEWEARTGLSLPLGGIAALRTLPPETVELFDSLLRDSILYAMNNPQASHEYVKSHARELDDTVIDSHISLFVNEYSLSLGTEGRRAIKELTGVGVPPQNEL